MSPPGRPRMFAYIANPLLGHDRGERQRQGSVACVLCSGQIAQLAAEPLLVECRLFKADGLRPAGDSRRRVVAARLVGAVAIQVVHHQRPETN